MTSTVLDVKSVAASGTDVVSFVLPSTGSVPVSAKVGVAVKYAAVAGTSGVSLSFKVSKDGGSTWVNAAETGVTCAPAATVLGTAEKKIYISGPNKLNSAPITAIQVTATNLDGTNAALVALSYETSDVI